jgi:hypothetical protein
MDAHPPKNAKDNEIKQMANGSTTLCTYLGKKTRENTRSAHATEEK